MRRYLWLVILALAAAPVAGGPAQDRWGAGVEGGVWKLVEGYWDYSNVDEFAGLSLRHGLSPNWILDLGLRYGTVHPRVAPPGFASFDNLTTEIINPTLTLQYQFSPAARLTPFMGLGAGATSWRVVAAQGTTSQGFRDDDDQYHKLASTNVTLAAELGLEWWLSDALSLRLGGRYHILVGNHLDNIGLGGWDATNNKTYVDANTGLVEGFLGLSLWFGSSDADRDGYPKSRDGCPDEAEDFDGFEDQDGCPDLDNDGDGILDRDDTCPNQAEDLDGFQDEDGCPDPDNDGDGVLDAADACPDTPAGVAVGADGCPLQPPAPPAPIPTPIPAPIPAPIPVPAPAPKPAPKPIPVEKPITLEGVEFKTGSAELTPESISVLAGMARTLLTTPTIKVEVRGHTDSSGSPEANRQLSQRRATAVRDVLIQMGVPAANITAVGYGADAPIADNATPEGRALNRRVELHKVGG